MVRKSHKKHQGNPQAAATEIGATLLHLGSTDDDARHWDCPVGDWCKWADHMAAGTPEKDWPAHDEMNHRLPRELCNQLIPLYARLSSQQLLKRCQQGITTNANEALHSMVWKHVPKGVFIGRKRMEIGVEKAITNYNYGTSSAFELEFKENNIKFGRQTKKIVREMDRQRKKQQREQIAKKDRRRKRKWYEKDDATLVEEEGGPSYLPMDVQLDDISSEEEDRDLNLSFDTAKALESKVDSSDEDHNQPSTSIPIPTHRFYGKKPRKE